MTIKQNTNKGFSLVELIIVVSILAIAAIPLMRSMALASRTNATAQSMQNATSLAENIMEEMKSTPIETIDTKYNSGSGFSGDVMSFTIPGVTATQGETFDATVTIDKGEYSDVTTTPDPDDKKKNVGSANSVLLPKIEDIDTLSQAVLTSTKELNRYDEDALSYFNQKIADYPATQASIKEKTINITKGDVDSLGVSTPGVTVKANVTYKDNSGNEYYRDLYTGTFAQQSGEKLDSNIYILYKKGIATSEQPVINITDESAYSNPSNPSESHRIYFIRQDSESVGPKVVISRNSKTFTFKYSNTAGLLDEWYNDSGTDLRLITNIVEGHAGSTGYIYDEHASIRIYKITVELKKGSDVYATLTSTSTVNDEL